MAFLLASCLYGGEFVSLNGFLFCSRGPCRIFAYPNCSGLQQGKSRHLGPVVLHCSLIEPENEQKQTVSNSDNGNNYAPSGKQGVVDSADGTSVCEDSIPGLGGVNPLEKNTKLPTKPQYRVRPSVEGRPKVSAIEQLTRFFEGFQKFLAPRHKGDIRDVMLMSLSFAVYVYISQQIVCAYCMWQSMSTN